MKSDDIQRAVQSRPEHLARYAPASGRYARMQVTEQPKGVRRRKMTSESNQGRHLQEGQKQLIIIRSILLCGLTFAVLVYFLVQWMMPYTKQPEVYSSKSESISANAGITKKVSQIPTPTSAAALALVKQALALRDPEKVAEYFRPDGASPQEIIDFLKGMDASDGQIDGMQWLSSMGTIMIPLEGVLVSFKSKGEEAPRSRIVVMTSDPAGKWRIDYDAFARMVTPSWNDLLKKQTATATVRVYVKPDNYYNGPFNDEKLWVCYSTCSPDTEETLKVYCKIGSPQTAAMASMCSKGDKVIRATLLIRRVEGTEARQFEISKVLAEDWVAGPAPFDEGFK